MKCVSQILDGCLSLSSSCLVNLPACPFWASCVFHSHRIRMTDMSGGLLGTSQVLAPLRSHGGGPRMTDLSDTSCSLQAFPRSAGPHVNSWPDFLSTLTIRLINAVCSLCFLLLNIFHWLCFFHSPVFLAPMPSSESLISFWLKDLAWKSMICLEVASSAMCQRNTHRDFYAAPACVCVVERGCVSVCAHTFQLVHAHTCMCMCNWM